MKPNAILPLIAFFAIAATASVRADQVNEGTATGSGDAMGELATQLSNPVASLISVPFQSNFDFGGGPEDEGFQYKLNLQPVVPLNLNEDWKLITRTILPYIYQRDRIGTGSQSGLGDTTMSLFLSPRGESAWIWGLGPELYLPTATDDLLGAEKWGAGPTALMLKQDHGWTQGLLANHIWSYAGENRRQDLSNTFLQPFLSYQNKHHTTYGANLESTYDWENEQWTVPVNLFVTQMAKIGGSPVSFQLGGRYYAEKPDMGPDWGLRFAVTLLFPQ